MKGPKCKISMRFRRILMDQDKTVQGAKINFSSDVEPMDIKRFIFKAMKSRAETN